MSWVDRFTQNLKITTGDNKTFELFTRPSFVKDLEFNSTTFNFAHVDGALVKKKKIKRRDFPLEFYFCGEDCIENAKLFEESLKDENPSLIEHPYYDTILAQIIGIKFDDTELNVTKCTCIALETITNDGLLIQTNPIDLVNLKKIELDDMISSNPEITPTIQDVDTLKANNTKSYNEGVRIINIPEQAEEYFNAFNEANSAVNAITSNPIFAMQALTNFINMPSQFQANVNDRIRTLLNQFNNLRLTLNGLKTSPTTTPKRLYEYQMSTLLTAICKAAVTPLQNNYRNASSAVNIIQLIFGAKKQLLADLDTLQGLNGGLLNSYFPRFDVMNNLNDIVDLTMANLYALALGGRKEISHVLTEDSNAILLTHRFYGLDPQDNNLVEFCQNNNLSYREIALGIGKGRTVIYYV